MNWKPIMQLVVKAALVILDAYCVANRSSPVKRAKRVKPPAP
jgi:hypothetical protein